MSGAIARHWSILREAWRAQNTADRARQARRETEFLPAALEIIESPPSPLGRLLLLLLCALLFVALLWSLIAKIDIIVVGAGRVAPLESVKTVSWAGAGNDGMVGVVRALNVSEGQQVRRGDVLIALDPTMADAESAQARRGRDSAQAEAARAGALMTYLASGRIVAPALPGQSAQEAAIQAQLVRTTIAEYEARAASIAQQRAEKEAALADALTQARMTRDTLALLDREIAMRTELASKGYQSKVSLLQIQQMRIEREREIARNESLAVQTRAALADLAQQSRQLREGMARGSLVELTKASDTASVQGEELAKAQRRTALMQIRAPIDGTVEQLKVRTVGGAVQAAQPLLTIVPQGGALFIEALIPNAEIGFVAVGQPVQVKVDAFPFTDYGMLTGTVASIGRDSVEEPAAGDRPDLTPLSGFKVRIRLASDRLAAGACADRTAPCPQLRVSPGMRVQAEIRTGRRRIIQYLLSPLMSATAEAGRER